MSGRGRLIVISGPSGAGKTSICSRLLEQRPGVERVITCTTRSPRGKEKDSVDYHFLSREEFEKGIAGNRFLEHAEVHGQLYGTPRDQVSDGIRRGVTLLLNIDVQGARQLREAGIEPMTSIFVKAPDLDTLRERLVRRGTDTPETIERRIAQAREELKEAIHFDEVVVNDELERAVSEVLRAMERTLESL